MATNLLLLLLLKCVHSYIRFENVDNWAGAESYCVNQCGSHLASIHSQNDWNDVLNLGKDPNNKDIWIGLNEPNGNNLFEWSDNTSWDFGHTFNNTPWKYDQPNDSGATCVLIFGGARLWGDSPCNLVRPFICNACGQPTTSNPTTTS
eukprot:81846_1